MGNICVQSDQKTLDNLISIEFTRFIYSFLSIFILTYDFQNIQPLVVIIKLVKFDEDAHNPITKVQVWRMDARTNRGVTILSNVLCGDNEQKRLLFVQSLSKM